MPPAQDLGPIVVAANVTLVAGIALLGAILVAREKRLFSGRIKVGDPILGALSFAVLVPAVIVAIFGAAATQANTGIYPKPDDYRNSADYVAWNMFFVGVVAPLVSAVGWMSLAWLGVWRLLRRRRPTKSGSAAERSRDGGSGGRRPVHSRAHKGPRST